MPRSVLACVALVAGAVIAVILSIVRRWRARPARSVVVCRTGNRGTDGTRALTKIEWARIRDDSQGKKRAGWLLDGVTHDCMPERGR